MPRLGPCALALALVAGCRGITTEFAYPDDLTHPNYLKRTKATLEFARRGDRERVPEAFGLLLDEEQQIRAIAHQALRDLTGEDFGYRSHLDAEVRAGIVARWKAWWRAGGEEAGG